MKKPFVEIEGGIRYNHLREAVSGTMPNSASPELIDTDVLIELTKLAAKAPYQDKGRFLGWLITR